MCGVAYYFNFHTIVGVGGGREFECQAFATVLNTLILMKVILLTAYGAHVIALSLTGCLLSSVTREYYISIHRIL